MSSTAPAIRNAVITGGSGGIGNACGRALIERGYDVMLAARREGPLRAAAEDIEARWVVADATDPAGFNAALGSTAGRPDRAASFGARARPPFDWLARCRPGWVT